MVYYKDHGVQLAAERLAEGGMATRYRLACARHEPIEPLNEPLNERVRRLVQTHPGVRLPYLKSVVGASEATAKRALAALVRAGRVEHRGSKKTGGYYAVGTPSDT